MTRQITNQQFRFNETETSLAKQKFNFAQWKQQRAQSVQVRKVAQQLG
jgi:hypothetical protein